MRRALTFWCVPASVVLCGSVCAQTASLVADINPASTFNIPSFGSTPRRGPLMCGSFLYFVAFDNVHGWELWRTDGTTAGTRMAMDAYPGFTSGCDPLGGGSQSRDPLFRGPAGSIMFFARTEAGIGLWAVHPDGWIGQVSPGSPGDPIMNLNSETQPIHAAVMGDSVYFAANAVAGGVSLGQVLWASDGTAAGTRVVFDPPRGTVNVIGEISVLGNRLIFACNPSNGSGMELWTSDGTSAGTSQLVDLNPASGQSSTPHNFVRFGTDLYFFALPVGQSFARLFKTDGTVAGTVQMSTTIAGNLNNEQMVATSEGVYFVGSGGTIYRCDGTVVAPPAGGGAVNSMATTRQIAVLDDHVYFAWTPRISRIEHDGSLVTRFGPASFSVGGDLLGVPGSGGAPSRLYFTAGTSSTANEAYVADAALTSLTLLKDVNPGIAPGGIRWLGAIGERAIFGGNDQSFPNGGGEEPYVTDGTPEGTALLRDIYGVTSDSAPGDMFEFNGHLYFDAGTAAEGTERRRLDPPSTVVTCDETTIGTSSLARDLPTVAGTHVFSRILSGATVFIQAADSAEGVGTSVRTVTGTSTYNGQLYSNGSLCFFHAEHPDTTTDEYTVPWRSDGTAEGTFPLADLAAGQPSQVYAWTQYQGETYFLARIFSGSTANYYGLYATGGTFGTTRGIANVGGGTPNSATIQMLTAGGGKLFFNAFVEGAQTQLWVYDGDGAPIRRVRPSSSSTGSQLYCQNPVVFNDRILWGADIDQINDAELWSTDGTFAGTVRVKDIYPGTKGSGPINMKGGPSIDGPRIYFSATDPDHGRELWISDGTESGTRLVKDIFPGMPGSMPQSFTPLGGKMYFVASDGVHGLEWWVTDGTDAGTHLVTDIYPGAASSFPVSVRPMGDKIYFSASDDVHGRELWAISPSCAADFNHDDEVDFFDYLDFVAAFASGDPAADFNADSVTDFFDYLDFVAAFSAGCA